jgi:hypothetical protein
MRPLKQSPGSTLHSPTFLGKVKGRNFWKLEEFLATGDPNVDPEDGHPLAYETILRESQKYETTPLFLKEDCEMVVNDPHLAANVPEWLAKSRQVATGNRRRVLEDGIDVTDSSDEDDPKMKPDELTGVYTAEMDPKEGPRVLSSSEAAHQRMVGKARKEHMIQSVPRIEDPEPEEAFPSLPQVDLPKSGGSSDDDTLERPEYIWSESKGINRRNKAWIKRLADSALALPAPEPERKHTPLTSPANSDDEEMSEDQRRALNLGKKMARRSATKPVPEAKASSPRKGQESPETKVSKPMVTRSQTKASGAGGLRGGAGSGQSGTVRGSSSPARKPGS